jgi:N-acetylneuraminic acid mutarotase
LRHAGSILSLFLALALSGCGGSSINTPTPTPTPTPPPAPTPAPAVVSTWMGGSNTISAPNNLNGGPAGNTGVYGALGAAAAANIPGSRWGSVPWTDTSGNLWLFGGYAFDATGRLGLLDDLWEFNPANNEWTWKGGSSVVDIGGCTGDFGPYGPPGFYGTMGVPSTNNVPGGRQQAVSWSDSSGNLWLFGGDGCIGAGTESSLNDLWEFNPQANTWTWVSGSNTEPTLFGGQPGIYGTLGTPSATNTPGARLGAVSWTDSSGNLWLFGGLGFALTGSAASEGLLNDLWEFNPTAKTWAWVSGSNTTYANGIYGTLGVPSTGNVPGAREYSVSWTDKSGNLWLFGGEGGPAGVEPAGYNDLWEFNPTAKTWTWVSGSDTGNTQGVYGTLGVAAASNVPEGRIFAQGWTDQKGNLWLFGGGGFESTQETGGLNDFWEFDMTNREWMWMGGNDTDDSIQPGIYGMLGVAAATNAPGERDFGWTDSSGNFWLFGGIGVDSTGNAGYLNDLWRIQP